MRIKKSIIAIMLIVVCTFVCSNKGYASEEMSDEFKAILSLDYLPDICLSLYVPSDVEYTTETLLQTAQKRINDYLQNDTSVVLSYGGLFSEADQYTSASEHEEFLNVSGVEHYFVANVNGLEHKLLIIPNSEKMYTPTYKSIDLDTNVEINTDSFNLKLHSFSGNKYYRKIG